MDTCARVRVCSVKELEHARPCYTRSSATWPYQIGRLSRMRSDTNALSCLPCPGSSPSARTTTGTTPHQIPDKRLKRTDANRPGSRRQGRPFGLTDLRCPGKRVSAFDGFGTEIARSTPKEQLTLPRPLEISFHKLSRGTEGRPGPL